MPTIRTRLPTGSLALKQRSGAGRHRSGAAGAAGVREHYTVERMAEQVEAVYRELAGRQRSTPDSDYAYLIVTSQVGVQ